MNPGLQAPAIATSLADRLATLAGFWPNQSRGREHTNPREELDAFRNNSNAIAILAETSGQFGLARALCRIALLSEIWECLANEPDQAAAAAELADFCQAAIEHLVCDQRTGGDDLGICDKIIGESDARWSNYLSPLDSIGDGQSAADDPVSFDEASTAYDDAPPALDQETLLRILSGSGEVGKTPAQPKNPSRT